MSWTDDAFFMKKSGVEALQILLVCGLKRGYDVGRQMVRGAAGKASQ